MSNALPPNPWTRGESWFRCPLTGLWTSYSERVWSRGRWVHPKGFDRLGFDEEPDTSAPDPGPPPREVPPSLNEV